MRLRRTLVLAGLALAFAIVGLSFHLLSAGDEPAPRKLAFLVGVKNYKHADLKTLDFPENDVEDLADVLKRMGYTVTVMSTRAPRSDKRHYPDADNIRQELAAMLKGASKQDLILVGLAGHGLQPLNSSQSYFCPHDANPSEKNGDVAHPETLLSTGEILTQIRDSGIGQKLLLVDACRNDPGVRGGRRGAGTIQFDVSALPQTGVLLSCDRGEFSFESNSFGGGHGAFFYEVIEGLNGAAKDEDGNITWDNLQSYVRKHVRSSVRKVFGKDGGDQNPNAIGNLTGEPTVLARITPGTRGEPEKSQPEAPKLLNSPFDQKDAVSARKAWAHYQQIDEEKKNSIGMDFVLVPPGQFSMGSSETIDELMKVFRYAKKDMLVGEWPVHGVTVSQPFYFGKYEVTKEQFKKFAEATGYRTEAEKDSKGGWGYTGNREKPEEQRASFTWRDWGVDQRDDSPVVNVSHNDAVAFCEWLSRKEGANYRLPTEAEWEYSCRAGTTGRFYNGDDPEDLTKIGNIADAKARETFANWPTLNRSDGWTFTSPVGQFQPNNFGLYDMIGNAWEWCADWYSKDYYEKSPERDPQGPSAGKMHLFRGGGWYFGFPAYSRCAFRSYPVPSSYRGFSLGFRVVRSL